MNNNLPKKIWSIIVFVVFSFKSFLYMKTKQTTTIIDDLSHKEKDKQKNTFRQKKNRAYEMFNGDNNDQNNSL